MTSPNQFIRNGFIGAFLVSGLIASAPCIAAPVEAAAHHQAVDTPWGAPGDASRVNRTIKIIGTDMKYNVAHLTFKKGETVKFVFVNKGVVAHELMIADAAEQAEHRNMMADMTGTSMSSGGHSDEKNVVDAKPGETKELIWHFTKKGKFQFACNYVGHAEAGMIGTIDVR